ncbi:unnamed protein product [Dicrocoelium dendriticum]|nr:unnamed protein product [Dicrocoelium dendriticum]
MFSRALCIVLAACISVVSYGAVVSELDSSTLGVEATQIPRKRNSSNTNQPKTNVTAPTQIPLNRSRFTIMRRADSCRIDFPTAMGSLNLTIC